MFLASASAQQGQATTTVWRPSDPCALNHVWSNDYGDDWRTEVGTPCDCGQKRWGIPIPAPQGQSMRPDIDALAASVGSVGTDRRPTCKSLRDCSGPNCDCGQPAQQDSAGSDTVNTQYLTILGLCDTLVLMTKAQERLVQMLKARDGEEEYWPLMNDWVKDSGRAKALAFRNICRTVDAMVRDGLITVDDDGMVRLS
jgi:hypothetical protein